MQEGSAKALREKSSGLVRTIADWAYDTSVREYDELAIAVALAVIATCAQGTYKTPQGRVLSLYQLCILPAAGGKDHYLTCVSKVLTAVDDRMLCDKAGSSAGLRNELFPWNSRMWAIDEVQDFISSVSTTDNEFVKAITTDLKMLGSGTDCLRGTVTKSGRTPNLLFPRLSFFGVGTPEKLGDSITSDNIAGGLLSRFLYWYNDKPPFRVIRNAEPLHPEAVGKLRAIAALGRTEEGKKGEPAFFELQKLIQEGKAGVHLPQCKPELQLTFSAEAAHEFGLYDVVCQIKYLQNPLAADGAITDRLPEMALRLSSLHAIGCGRTEVSTEDVAWGCEVATFQGEQLARLAIERISSSLQENERKKILSSLRRNDGKRSRRQLATSLELGVKALDGFLCDLEARGDIEVKELGGKPARQKDGSFHHLSVVHLLAAPDV